MKSSIKSILFYIVVAILAIYVTLQVVAPQFTLTVFRFQPYVVLSGSMEPVINENDLVVVKNFEISELEPEDIITFTGVDVNYDGELDIVTHYIDSIVLQDDVYYIRTHGHFENPDDYYVDAWALNEDDILGLYNFHIPWIGTVVRFIQSPFGIAAILVNIGVIVGVVYIIKHNPENKEEPKEAEPKE